MAHAQDTGTDIYTTLWKERSISNSNDGECKTLDKARENKLFQDAMIYLFSEISNKLIRNEDKIKGVVSHPEEITDQGIIDEIVVPEKDEWRHGIMPTSTRTTQYRQNIFDAVFSKDNKTITAKNKKIMIQIIEYAFKETHYAQRLLTRMLNKWVIGKNKPYVTAAESIFRDEKGRIDASRIYNELIKKVNAMKVE